MSAHSPVSCSKTPRRRIAPRRLPVPNHRPVRTRTLPITFIESVPGKRLRPRFGLLGVACQNLSCIPSFCRHQIHVLDVPKAPAAIANVSGSTAIANPCTSVQISMVSMRTALAAHKRGVDRSPIAGESGCRML